MKHLRILLPLLILALILSGCGKQSPEPYTYTFSRDNQVITLTVNPETRTILDGTDVYDYVAEKHGSITSYVITYPNGATYHWTATEYGGAGGWSDDYDEIRYIPGDFLVDALDQAVSQTAPYRERKGNVGIGLLLMGLGAVSFLFPEVMFHLRKGWMFWDAEPSDAYLTWSRISGVIIAVLGLIFCII